MKNEINESVYDINMDKLCQNSIELIKYARNITAKQVNNVQIMTYYSLGRWIVEVQQQGKHRAEYGKKIIINLSKKLTLFFKNFPNIRKAFQNLRWKRQESFI